MQQPPSHDTKKPMQPVTVKTSTTALLETVSVAVTMMASSLLGVALVTSLLPPKSQSAVTGSFTISLTSEEPQISPPANDGYSTISVKDFDSLGIPGEPDLPTRTYHILMPPGAKLASIDVLSEDREDIKGEFTIRYAATPQPTQTDVLHPAVEQVPPKKQIYASDALYPAASVTAESSGLMRKYSIQDIRFNPIQYHPLSKTLRRTVSMIIRINYLRGEALPEETKQDVAFDTDASTMLYNYGQFKKDYVSQTAGRKSTTFNYAIIAPASLSTSAGLTSLVQYRQNQGISVKVETTEWIMANITGSDTQEKIRNYLKTNYVSWGLKNVTLVGSPTSIPMRNCVLYPPDDPIDPTDYYYSELTGIWNATALHCGVTDWYPEVYVGRIPLDDAGQLQAYVDRIKAFEASTDPYKKRVLLAGARWSEYGDGATEAEYLLSDVFTPASYPTTRMYEETGTCPTTYPHDLDISRPNVVDHWRDNHFGIVFFAAHGTPSRLCTKPCPGSSCESVFERGDIPQVNNGYPSIVFSDACDTISYLDPDNLGISLIRQGAISYVGSTVYGWTSLIMHRYYFSNLVQGIDNGESFALARLQDWPAEHRLGFNLLGEPLISLTTCAGGIRSGSCSASQQFCDKGALVQDCRKCGFQCTSPNVCNGSNGSCVRCLSTADCTDNISCNTDSCQFPGTASSYCSHSAGTCCADGTQPGNCSAGRNYCTSKLELSNNYCQICGCPTFYKCNPNKGLGEGSCVQDPASCCMTETLVCKKPLCPWAENVDAL